VPSMKDLLNDQRSESPAPTDTGIARFLKEIGAELKHQAEAGSHEMAAALFRGDAFVMYPHAGKEAEGGVHGPDSMAGLKAMAEEVAGPGPELGRENDRGMGL